MEVAYNEDMEGRSCTLTLPYDLTIVDRPASRLSFDVKSNDLKLIVSNKLKEYRQLKFIFGIIAMVALAIFGISLPRKMLGVELLNCCQISFLSLCLYSPQKFIYSALKGLSLVTGEWSFFGEGADFFLIPGLTDRITISSLFAHNSAFVAGSLVLIVGLWSAFMLAKHCGTCDDSPEESDKKVHRKR